MSENPANKSVIHQRAAIDSAEWFVSQVCELLIFVLVLYDVRFCALSQSMLFVK